MGLVTARSAVVCFFFSSRRRHTRCCSDWSSDVCFPIYEQQAAGFRPQKCRFQERLGKQQQQRSGERRVGEEGRSRGSPDQLKKKKKTMRQITYTVALCAAGIRFVTSFGGS